jgi:hypothetical protein
MKLWAVFFAILAVVAAQKPTLFSVVTEFASKGYATASHLVTIDPKTGAVGDLLETFFYAGGSITVDGVSAFDFLNNVYYYVTDGNSDFVFRGNVNTKTLMSPIAFPFEYIFEITFDVTNKRIIVAGAADKQGDFLVAFPTDESKPWSVIAQIDTDFSFDCGTIDSKNQIYYWVTLQKVNNTFSNAFLHSVSLTNPTTIHTVQIMCTYPMLYPNAIRYDARHDKLYIFSTQWILQGKNYELVSYIETVNPTSGSCNAIKTQIPDGIVGDWAYDAITQHAYAALATNSGNFLYTIDVTTGQVISNVLVANAYMPESMEFAYV